ncbi:MAG: histidine kinase [Terrimesophilobacter sp.]
MDNPKWWNIAVVALAAILSVMLLALSDPLPMPAMIGGQVTLLVFVAAWFTLGRMSWRSPRAGVAFITIMIVSTGIGTFIYPTLASLQCVAYPLLWTICDNRRRALIANIALAVTVAVAFMARFGFTSEAIVSAIFIATLSLGFSIALGLWISHIFDLSAERLQLLEELRAAEGNVAALHREAGIVSERERLSRELHDTLAQGLTGLVMITQGARRDLDAGSVERARNALDLLEENARAALIETRSLVASGAAVEVPGGIVPALQRLSERFERETGVAVTATADDLPALDRATEVVLLRCAQEALANIRKHSSATTATVEVHGSSAHIELRVTDDGV